ncbi:MAG: PEP-CTERM sorting domain-containing protein [Phycisphaerales bacterium]|nr:MAG: PEP-CTERM sorting domain-containing protein [Phycisphaerales bacterium]
MIAVAGLAGAAAAQNYEVAIDYNGTTYGFGGTNDQLVIAPGETVSISVWGTGGNANNIPGFTAWDSFSFFMDITGTFDLGGITTFVEDLSETAPIPSATPSTGWANTPDTWTQGRRPGGGVGNPFNFLNSRGFRYAPVVGAIAQTYEATSIPGGLRVTQSGNQFVDMFAGNSTLISTLFEEYVNFEEDIEIFRIDYTPTTEGDHVVSATTVGATAFLNGSFAVGQNVLPLMLEGDSFTVTVIPAPGAFALLGLGGLVAVRRRR